MTQPTPEPVAIKPAPAPEPVLSALPMPVVSEIDAKFAQAALKQLGFSVGFVDGIWGPRSATAIQQFELAYQLETANGHLSELNFSRLTQASTIQRQEFTITPPTNQSRPTIKSKLDSQIPLSESPQLIIIDKAYAVLAKPNPYSEIATELPIGAGMYVINLLDGWYQVESLDRVRGYIKE